MSRYLRYFWINMRDQQRKSRIRTGSLKTPISIPTVAVGVDLVSVKRVESSVRRIPSLSLRLFSPEERRFSGALSPKRRAEWLAGRFAAKEAIAKAVGLNLYDVAPSELFEVLPSAAGAPTIRWLDTALAADLSDARCDISISHEGGFAIAVAVVAMMGDSRAPTL